MNRKPHKQKHKVLLNTIKGIGYAVILFCALTGVERPALICVTLLALSVISYCQFEEIARSR